MQDMTLVIMAAGMGSRFGGLKQIEPFGPSGEFLIDYSIYDAIKAGFNKIIFIIKPENLEVFKETIGKRIEDKITVLYAFQDLEKMKEIYDIPKDRVKPLGTTQAILSAKDLINEPFVVINADDFYGREAFLDAVQFFKETNYQKNGIILYKIINTLTENGKVKRGICKVVNDKLMEAIECSVGMEDGKIMAEPLSGKEAFELPEDNPVSMNMFALLPDVLPKLQEVFDSFMQENTVNLDKCEALIIEDLFKLVNEKQIELEIKLTSSSWFGVTYKEDKEAVSKKLQEYIEKGLYPKDLWQ